MSLIVVASCLARKGVSAGTVVHQPEVFSSVSSWVFDEGREAEALLGSPSRSCLHAELSPTCCKVCAENSRKQTLEQVVGKRAPSLCCSRVSTLGLPTSALCSAVTSGRQSTSPMWPCGIAGDTIAFILKPGSGPVGLSYSITTKGSLNMQN